MTFVQKLAAQPMLTLSAICLGVFVVVADRMLFATMLGRAPDFSEPAVLVTNGLSVAAPFAWLAYRGSTRLVPWLAGIVFTLWLHWRWLLNGVEYQRAPDWSGVPMGFALLMLVSPLFIGLACAWLDEVLRQFQLIRAGEASRRRSLLGAALAAPSKANRKWLSDAASAWRRF